MFSTVPESIYAMNTIQDVPEEGRDQGKDKRAGGHFSIPEYSN
jgi:hypothetical protein